MVAGLRVRSFAPINLRTMMTAAIQILEVAAVVVAGTMTGNEIAVAVFVHPRISRLADAVHLPAVQTLGSVLGAVMPFWYASPMREPGRRLVTTRHGARRGGWHWRRRFSP